MKAVLIAAMVAYPVLVYGGLQMLPPRTLAVALGVVVLLRGVTLWRGGRPWLFLVPVVLVSGIMALAAIFDEGRFFLFVPVLINAALLISFSWTLFASVTIVETLAQRRLGHLTRDDVQYCRRVTEMWCVFFLANGGVILWLAMRASLATWTFYTGFLSYVFLGLLAAGELTYRSWRFRRYEGAVTDVFFRRLFPPRPVG